MSANEILKMIETVSPDDTATLNEIDKAVEQYLHQKALKFEDHDRRFCRDSEAGFIWFEYERLGNIIVDDPNIPIRVQGTAYTRSRDALKSIRPEGWLFSIHPDAYNDCKPHATLEIRKELRPWWKIWSKYPKFLNWETDATCETETLAELHAIIQAIEYERKNK